MPGFAKLQWSQTTTSYNRHLQYAGLCKATPNMCMHVFDPFYVEWKLKKKFPLESQAQWFCMEGCDGQKRALLETLRLPTMVTDKNKS